MSEPFDHHERLHRGPAAMDRLRGFTVTVCGAGALGANVTESLARSGFRRLRVIDRDRVEERNLSTQPYHRSDIGAQKARVLAAVLYRAVGVEIEARAEALTSANAERLLAGSALVIDSFDNATGREAVAQACRNLRLPCLHAGLATDYAEILWNEVYRVPASGREDPCDYPLARNLVILTVALTCEAVVVFATTGQRRNLTVTLVDLTVREWPE